MDELIDPLEKVDPLERARLDLKLSRSELWWRYFAIGGMSGEFEIEAILSKALVPSTEDLDLLAVVINERFQELGGDHPMPYSTDSQDS